DVRPVFHRRIGFLTMRFPNRSVIETLERLPAREHVRESANPHEAPRTVSIAELSDDAHSHRLLTLDEFSLKEINEHVALARMQTVLSKLEDVATTLHRHHDDCIVA